MVATNSKIYPNRTVQIRLRDLASVHTAVQVLATLKKPSPVAVRKSKANHFALKFLEESSLRQMLAGKNPPRIYPLQTSLRAKFAIRGEALLSSLRDAASKVVQGRCLLVFNSSKAAQNACRRLQDDKLLEYAEMLPTRTFNQAEVSPWPVSSNLICRFDEGEQLLDPIIYQNNDNRGRVKVAVLDTGVDVTHPDLSKLLETPKYLEEKVVVPAIAKGDSIGHGTKMIAAIAAIAANTAGIRGAYRPARLISYKIFDGQNLNIDAYHSSLRDALDHADVINLSLSGLLPDSEEKDLIKEALDRKIMVVAAMGNRSRPGEQMNPAFPARLSSDFDNVIAVGGCDKDRNLWDRSPTGSHLNLLGPAVAVETVKLPSGAIESVDGTSIATAYVTAAVAMTMDAIVKHSLVTLNKSRRPDPRKLKNLLLDNCVSAANSTKAVEVGKGILDIVKTLNAIIK